MNNQSRTNTYKALSCLLISFCLILSSCSKKQENTEKSIFSKNDSYSVLEYIPADTPYVVVGLEPVSKKLIKKFENVYDGLFDTINKSIALEADEDDWAKFKDPEFKEENPWAYALANEFISGDEIDFSAFKKFGFDWTSTGAIYGNGILPVARVRLSKPKLFTETVKRLEKNSGETLNTIQIDKQSAWTFENEKFQLLVSLQGNELVVTGAPLDADENFLSQVLGFTKPAKSLANTKSIHALMKEKNYVPQSLGFFDFEQIVSRYINEPSGLDKQLFELLDVDISKREELSDVCKSEYKQIAANFPRLVIGATQYDEKALAYEMLLEVRDDIAKDLSGLTASVPGLGNSQGFFSMGMSMNMPNIQKFAAKQIQNHTSNPYKCEKLNIPEEEIAKLQQSLANPALGFAEGVRGFNFVVDELDPDFMQNIMDLEKAGASKNPAEAMKKMMEDGFSGYALFAVDNTENLYNLGKMFSPELVSLDLKMDGDSVLVNDLIPEPIPFDIYAGMSKHAFTFSFGEESKSRNKKLTKLKAESNSPLLSYSMDFEAYLQAIVSVFENPEFMEKTGQGDLKNQQMSAELSKEIITSLYGLYSTGTFSLRLREDGIAIESRTNLK